MFHPYINGFDGAYEDTPVELTRKYEETLMTGTIKEVSNIVQQPIVIVIYFL